MTFTQTDTILYLISLIKFSEMSYWAELEHLKGIGNLISLPTRSCSLKPFEVRTCYLLDTFNYKPRHPMLALSSHQLQGWFEASLRFQGWVDSLSSDGNSEKFKLNKLKGSVVFIINACRVLPTPGSVPGTHQHHLALARPPNFFVENDLSDCI
jgi:hypothetical protein